ncbi:glycosyltransferase family 2 protein [Neoaquamicrobium sediminum]|uniref:Glycosyltransferase family A protein n=1 Tax=Neoaquamicrobium sediminum TaxID=1849104 RepID=A0ABV3WWD8_9HYPH
MSDKMASIDILVPSYNYARYLDECLRSIRSYRGSEMRVLVIDNASTDESVAIARRHASEDSRIEVRARTKNLGSTSSFNEGIDWAHSDYFAVLCADDLFTPGALARAVAIMERHRNVNLVYGPTRFVMGDDEASLASTDGAAEGYQVMAGGDFLEEFCRTGRNPVAGPAVVVRTSTQKRVGHYRAELTHTDDVELWMRFAAIGDVAQVDATQVISRIHGENKSSAVRDVHMWNVEMERAFNVFFAGPGANLAQAERLKRLAVNSLAARAYWCAVSHLVRREPGVANLIRFALSRRPSFAVLPPVGSLMTRGDAMERIAATLRSVTAGGVQSTRG